MKKLIIALSIISAYQATSVLAMEKPQAYSKNDIPKAINTLQTIAKTYPAAADQVKRTIELLGYALKGTTPIDSWQYLQYARKSIFDIDEKTRNFDITSPILEIINDSIKQYEEKLRVEKEPTPAKPIKYSMVDIPTAIADLEKLKKTYPQATTAIDAAIETIKEAQRESKPMDAWFKLAGTRPYIEYIDNKIIGNALATAKIKAIISDSLEQYDNMIREEKRQIETEPA